MFILLPSTLVAVYRYFLLLFDRNEMVIWGWVCDKTTLNWLKKGNVVRMIGVHTSVSLIIAMCKCWIQWWIWWANQIQVSDSRYLIINSCFWNLIKGLRNYLKWLKTIFCLYRKKFRPKQKNNSSQFCLSLSNGHRNVPCRSSMNRLIWFDC